MHCLIEAADGDGPIEFARMGMLQAIDRHVVARVRPFEKGLAIEQFPDGFDDEAGEGMQKIVKTAITSAVPVGNQTRTYR